MRPPVRLPGDELVVDREIVQAEPEQGVRVQHLRDEVVDRKVGRARSAPGLDARAQDDREVVPARIEHVREQEADTRERHEQRPRAQEAPVGHCEHEQADAEAEHAAS